MCYGIGEDRRTDMKYLIVLCIVGCTTNFGERDGWEDTTQDTELDTGLLDSVHDSLEVPEDVEDDGGGVTDTAEDIPVDTGPDTEDPCLYYPTWYRDQDMDSYGRDDLTVCFPTQPEGYVDRGGDCCDARYDVHPDVTEWHAEPYNCPVESWDWNCDGTEEIRWPGLDPARCEPSCGHDCYEFGTTEELCNGIWWDGGVTPPCGEGYASYQCRWETYGDPHCVATGGPFQPQNCR